MNPRLGSRKELLALLYKFFFPKNAPNRFRRLRALREPVLRSLRVDLHLNGVSNRVVLSDHLQETAVSSTALVDHNNPVIGAFLRPDPGQTHGYQTVSLLNLCE